jgi:hypothetical protein
MGTYLQQMGRATVAGLSARGHPCFGVRRFIAALAFAFEKEKQ